MTKGNVAYQPSTTTSTTAVCEHPLIKASRVASMVYAIVWLVILGVTALALTLGEMPEL